MPEIDLSRTLFDIVKDFPEVQTIMAANGFKEIAKPGMLQTAGRYMTIPKGAKMKKIPLAEIVTKFEEAGFIVKGVD
ncbi:DUF1858 domain-containing protein [Enterococcus alishanensis]|uniref:DUF1858 domain-containing protein n=1 Tax=Enterococcus alishanensis TaxID=1303817 RepID=A0ABS6TAW9_9ENTE|nr:DUF1858 domain-containing protein [Enterococcus alishanensis]MBV7390030.1 DUF1858 domain-containing protein [Enterococcus alishanensis]